MNNGYTADMVRGLLQSRLEDEETPAAIKTLWEKNEGKLLTKRILSKLPDGEMRWRISHSAGMTHLEEWIYTRTGGREGHSFLLSYETVNVHISTRNLTEYNVAYFDARTKRNAERRAAMADENYIYALRHNMNVCIDAREALKGARDRLSAVIDMSFSADRSMWFDLVKGEE